jgi:hypothetical protein
MDLSKYKHAFLSLLHIKQNNRQQIYQNLWDNKDGPTALIATQIETSTTRTQPLAPVPPTSSEINEEENLKMQQEAYILRNVLSPDVSEATIYNLLQKYNTAQVALNAYYENQQSE